MELNFGVVFDYFENSLEKFDDGLSLGSFSLVDADYDPLIDISQQFLPKVIANDLTEGRPKMTGWA